MTGYHQLADHDARRGAASGRGTADGEDLPYKVELWNETRVHVEQVLAVTVNGSIGYAAYYAATREHPDRYITLPTRIASCPDGTRPSTDGAAMAVPAPSPEEELPYGIELWHADRGDVERVLARAVSTELAQAIFKAILGEYPQRRITLRKGSATISDSAG
jgi:hypothetical protein